MAYFHPGVPSHGILSSKGSKMTLHGPHLEVCKTLRISQICRQNSATGFDHRVQNVLRVQNAVSWVSKFAVGAHFRGCVWLENFASVSEYAGVVWIGARFRGCSFSRVHRTQRGLSPVPERTGKLAPLAPFYSIIVPVVQFFGRSSFLLWQSWLVRSRLT